MTEYPVNAILNIVIIKNILKEELIMAKWRINYEGFAFIEADTLEEAKDKFDNDETIWDEVERSEPIEIGEFEIEI